MKTWLYIFFTVVLVVLSACKSSQEVDVDSEIVESITRVDSIWERTLSKALKEDLMTQRDMYDMGHFLMIPMHYAFSENRIDLIEQFDSFFEQYDSDLFDRFFSEENLIRKIQFLFLVSEYLALQKENQLEVNEVLYRQVMKSFFSYWNADAWLWSSCRAPDFSSLQERIEWKLNNTNVSIEYCRALFDQDIYPLAIAANMLTINMHSDDEAEKLRYAVSLFEDILSQEVVFDTNSNAWLLQPGVWSDHPNYWYAGWSEMLPELSQYKVIDIGEDSSHASRLPMWLHALQRYFDLTSRSEKSNTVNKLREGLASQLVDKVLIFPDSEFQSYRLNNYMDGNNGLYKYRYDENNGATGYGPYNLSGTLLIGWWSVLPGETINKVYCDLSRSFPLEENEIEVYQGPETRARHPLIMDRNQFTSGILELISITACKL